MTHKESIIQALRSTPEGHPDYEEIQERAERMEGREISRGEAWDICEAAGERLPYRGYSIELSHIGRVLAHRPDGKLILRPIAK